MSNGLQRPGGALSSFFRALTMTDADRANVINRNVTEYQPAPVESFFDPSTGVFNAIVSGGPAEIRASAMAAQAVCAAQNGLAAVVLHEGNWGLTQRLQANFSSTGLYREISAANPCFDPFQDMDELEISNMILEAAPKEYEIKPNARYYIAALGKYLEKHHMKLTFERLCTCPHGQIFDMVDSLHRKGGLTDEQSREIKSMLMTGQSECYKLQSFLDTFKYEIAPLLYQPNRGLRRISVFSAIQDGCVLSFDLGAVTNAMLLGTVISQLKLAMTRGVPYAVIFDSLPVSASKVYADYLMAPSSHVCKMIASDDLYAMVGGEEKTFHGIVGGCSTLIVMSHTSGGSAAKWSDIFGQYDRYEQSYTRSKGYSRRSYFSPFVSPNTQRTLTVNKNREYVVKPEEITRMSGGEAYVMSSVRGELAHLFLTG